MRLFLALLLTFLPSSAQTPSGIVSGHIRLIDGSPAAAVRVSAVEAAEAPTFREATLISSSSDEEGNFRLDGIPPGRYYVIAGIIDDPVFYPGTDLKSEATIVTVASGETHRNIDFPIRLPRAPSRGFSGINADRLQIEHNTSREVKVEGKVLTFTVRNPQSLIELESVESGKPVKWLLRWDTVSRLREYGVSDTTLKRGDVLVATGYPHNDPTMPILWLTHLRRPADGWRW